MLQTALLEADIYSEQPTLENHSNIIGIVDEKITNAYYTMIQDLINKNLEIKRLGTPLVLATKQLYSGTEEHDLSKADNINRQLLVLESYSSGTCNFKLFGTETDLTAKEEITGFFVDKSGTKKIFVRDLFKYYQLTKIDSVDYNYKCFMVESIYFYLHLYRTIADLFNALKRFENDHFLLMHTAYEEKYMNLLNTGKMSYDFDDDKFINSKEADRDTRIVRLTL